MIVNDHGETTFEGDKGINIKDWRIAKNTDTRYPNLEFKKGNDHVTFAVKAGGGVATKGGNKYHCWDC